jgi:hypothetical protein
VHVSTVHYYNSIELHTQMATQHSRNQ